MRRVKLFVPIIHGTLSSADLKK